MKAAAVFSDNMVLQRNRNIRIFGTCNDNEKIITVSIPEMDCSARASIKDGRWEAVLPPRRECDSCTLEISCGAIKKIFRNVAIGEVWLAGGQSNMEYELCNDRNGSQALAECGGERVRFYYTPKCEMADEKLAEAERSSCWSLPSAENSRSWSAVGYYFAKELSRKLGVTVGVIGCNWGGSSASAWMSREYLRQDSRLHKYTEEYDKAVEGKTDEEMIAEYDEYSEYQGAWDVRKNECYAKQPDIGWQEILDICGESRYPGPMGIKNPMRPCGLYETMLSRIAPYTLAGVLWYQGESDDVNCTTYDLVLRALIENWRRDWKDEGLPFMIVQLPMFRYSDEKDTGSWAYIREAQENVFRSVRNTGLAVCLDCGEFNNIHPVDKSAVAHRLYLQALSEVYGLCGDSEALPPMYDGYEVRDGRIFIYLRNCEGGLCGEPEGFEIAGADGVYYPAEAEIKLPCIVLSSSKVKSPSAARYKWINYAGVSLFGANGIPLPPFRTER